MSLRSRDKAFQPYLDGVNKASETILPRSKSGKTLKDFAIEWLEDVEVFQKASSKRSITSHLNSHITAGLGDCALSEVKNNVQTFVTELSRQDLTRKTITNVLGTLSSILRAAEKRGHGSCQFSRNDLTYSKKRHGRTVHTLDADQARAIVTHAKEPYRTMFVVLRLSGVRAQELRGLKVEDLDFKNKLIHVRRSIDLRTREEQETKTPSSEDSVPMPSELESCLRHFLQTHWRSNPKGFLFVNRNGNTFAHGKIVEYGLWPAQDACGITHTGLHAFRHGVGSQLAREGVSLPAISKQLRHKDVKTTLRYMHVIGDDQRNGMEKLCSQLESGA
jgi:integrase